MAYTENEERDISLELLCKVEYLRDSKDARKFAILYMDSLNEERRIYKKPKIEARNIFKLMSYSDPRFFSTLFERDGYELEKL